MSKKTRAQSHVVISSGRDLGEQMNHDVCGSPCFGRVEKTGDRRLIHQKPHTRTSGVPVAL